MVKSRENPIEIDDLGVPLFLETPISLSQWLNFKFYGITCLVRKIKFKLLFQGPGRLSEKMGLNLAQLKRSLIPTSRPFELIVGFHM